MTNTVVGIPGTKTPTTAMATAPQPRPARINRAGATVANVEVMSASRLGADGANRLGHVHVLWPRRHKHRHLTAIFSVLRMRPHEIALLELDRDQDVGRGHRGKQQV